MQPSQSQAQGQEQGMQIVQMLRDVRDRARQDIDKVYNPKVQALLEVTAEVVQGLINAYEDFEEGREKAWQ
jgi:hypothetical protein